MNKRFGIGGRCSSFVVATILLSSLVAAHPETPAQAVGVPSWWSSTNFVKATEISVGDQPSDLVVSPDGDFVYVADHGDPLDPNDAAVSVIEASTGTVIATVALDDNDEPVAIAVTPDGDFVYVANTGGGSPGGGSISVIDTDSRTVVEKFDLGGDADDVPSDIAISPDGSKAYITLPANNDVVYVDTSGDPLEVVGSITQTSGNFDAPVSVAFSPDSTRAYVANSGATDANVLSVIDVSASAVISNLATYTNNDNPELIAVSPIGGYGLMTVNQDGVLDRVDSFFVTADGTDGTNKGRSSAGWSRFTGLAFSDDGSRFYSVHNGSLLADDQLVSWSPVGMTPLGRGFDVTDPTGVATTPTTDSGYPIYVLHESTDKVTVFAQATPELVTTTGASGSTVTIELDTPEIGFDLAGDAVVGVLFNGVAASDLTASTGNTWTVTAPTGTGTVPVVVGFALGGRMSYNSAPAGNFTYSAEAGGGGGTSFKRATFDPAGGVCGENSTMWTVEFQGTYPLPTSSECRRHGHALLGWTIDPKPAGTGQLLSAVVNRPRIMTAVWGILPPAPARVDVFANFLCNQCTAAIVLWPASSEPSDTAVVSIGNVERTCVASGSLFALRWCWVTGLASRSTHVASVAWRNTNGVGPSANTSFGLR